MKSSKTLWALALLATVGVGIAWAQGAPRLFMQQVEVHRGNLVLGTSVDLVMEGTTNDAFETTITTEPTADRTWTIADSASDTFAGLAATQSFTNKTLGKGTTRVSYRQDFDEPCLKAEAADMTAELVTDAAVNRAICNGGIANFEYRLDGAQASPFVVIGGALDIDNDAASNEGVEIVVADTSNSTQGWVVVGTSPAMYARASISIASVSGTDNMYFGWKLAGAYVDQMVLETIDTGGFFHINDNAGNIEIQTADDTVDADDEADANPVWADAETIVLEVRVATDGSFTFYQDDVAVTVTTATGAAAAGDILVPVLAYEATADADAEITVNWIEVGEVI